MDFFSSPPLRDVTAARNELETAAIAAGWSVRRIRDTSTFCRLVIHADEHLQVDLALDAPPSHPSTLSIAGPTFSREELAGRKVIALFDRAEARDFADVYVLAQRYPKAFLLARASEIDTGFDLHVFRDMLTTLARFSDNEVPIAATEVQALRAFFDTWATELS